MDKKQLKVEVLGLIEKLPQRSVLLENDINNWVETLLEYEPERILWHVKRLSNFGGSDMGALVADYYNKERFESIYTHKSPQEIIGAKLLKVIPVVDKEEEPWLFRGNYFEDSIRNLYIDQLRENGHEVKIDHEFGRLYDNETLNGIPWLSGNIDLPLLINNKRHLSDIKFPSESACHQMINYGYPFEYLVQLNSYLLYAKKKQEVTGKVLPVESMGLAVMDHTKMKVHTLDVEISDELMDDIMTVGNNYWNNYVLKGKVPEYNFSYETLKLPTSSNDVTPQIVSISQKLSAIKLLSSLVENERKLTESEFQAVISTENYNPKEEFEVPTGVGSIKAKLEYAPTSDNALIKALKSLNIDMNEVKNKQGKLDIKAAVKKVLQGFDEQGKSVDHVIESFLKYEVRVTQKKKGVQSDLKKGAQERLGQAIQLIAEKLKSQQMDAIPDLVEEITGKQSKEKAVKKAAIDKQEKKESQNLESLNNLTVI